MGDNNVLKGWKLDAGKKGTRIIFRDYQYAIIKILVGIPGEKMIEWTTLEIWKSLKRKGIKISRASVIFYLEFLANDGLAYFVEEPGKGGMHKVYFMDRDWGTVKEHISTKITKALGEGLESEFERRLSK